jgi:2-polyprenyl-3-methyl-5-hydroxy-6-metoxy-1,4-benzoquinol methylase
MEFKITSNKTRLTDKEFLETELNNQISYENLAFRALGIETANQVKDLGIKTVLDYGAGVGVYADGFHVAGFQVSVYEIFEAHRNYMKEKVPHINIVDNPITTDLMLFIEVAEHMTDKELDKLFKTISPKYILFSSTSDTTPYDEQWGHINIKQQTEWITFFEKIGYTLLKDLSIPTSWTKLFIK